MDAKAKTLRDQVGEIADELATFMEENDPRSVYYRPEARRLIESLQERLTDMYNASEPDRPMTNNEMADALSPNNAAARKRRQNRLK